MADSSSLSERLETFIMIETACSVIYSRLRRLCPESEELWRRLAEIENNHAVTVMTAKKFLASGSPPEDLVHPSLPEMKRTLALVESMEERIRNSSVVPLPEALEMALELEGQECKEYFRTRLEAEDHSEEMSVLRELATDTTRHVEELRLLAEKHLP